VEEEFVCEHTNLGMFMFFSSLFLFFVFCFLLIFVFRVLFSFSKFFVCFCS
jgi:hypothetical protein